MVMVMVMAAKAGAQECSLEQALAMDGDGDGLPDAVELFFGTRVDQGDTDGDGVLDGIEVDLLKTDPLSPDTDGDGRCDGGRDVSPTCLAGEDWDEDGVIDQADDDTDPVCVFNGDFPVRRYPTAHGSSLFSCSVASSGGLMPVALCGGLALLTGARRRKRRRRHVGR